MLTILIYTLAASLCVAVIVIYFANNGIKRNSWHFILVDHFDSSLSFGEDAVRICPYVRTLLLGICISLIGGVFVSMLILTMITTLFWGLYDGDHPMDIAVISCLLWTVTGLIAYKYAHVNIPASKLNPNVTPVTQQSNAKPKEPSLLSIYLKSLHDKTCPTVKFK